MQIFELLNQTIANPFLDALLPVWREKTTWIPLYAIIAVLLYRAYGWRGLLALLVTIALTITVADQLAASVIKPWAGRLRPCATEGIEVRSLVGCGGKFSFPSNHATNHFALAVVLCLTWLSNRPWGWRLGILLWAASISLAQVYVGKHWPGDIVVGAALGTSVACGFVYLLRTADRKYGPWFNRTAP